MRVQDEIDVADLQACFIALVIDGYLKSPELLGRFFAMRFLEWLTEAA